MARTVTARIYEALDLRGRPVRVKRSNGKTKLIREQAMDYQDTGANADSALGELTRNIILDRTIDRAAKLAKLKRLIDLMDGI
jgi:hypothetical protein